MHTNKTWSSRHVHMFGFGVEVEATINHFSCRVTIGCTFSLLPLDQPCFSWYGTEFAMAPNRTKIACWVTSTNIECSSCDSLWSLSTDASNSLDWNFYGGPKWDMPSILNSIFETPIGLVSSWTSRSILRVSAAIFFQWKQKIRTSDIFNTVK